MLRFLLGLFFLAHGLIHASYLAPRPADAKVWPFDLGHSWLAAGFGEAAVRPVGLALVIAATLGFAAAGLGVFGVPIFDEAWRLLAVIGAGASILLLALFWHLWLVLGIVLSLATLIAVLWLRWPSAASASW